MHMFVARQGAEIGHRRMGPVEQPQLGVLPPLDRVGQLHPKGRKVRPLAGEPVLDHPLGEGLGLDHALIFHPETGAQTGHVVRNGGRHDPVDHGLGEGSLGLDPLGQSRVNAPRHGDDARADALAVVRNIIAADDREGLQPRRLSRRQRRDDEARRGARRGDVGQIGRHVRVVQQQVAGRRIEAIALLGHRQGDDVDVGVSHGGDQGGGVFRPHQNAATGADHSQVLLRPVAHDQGVETVLRVQLVAHARRAQRGPEDAPAQVATLQRIVEHHRLVGAVKGADAQMDHAGFHCGAVVAGYGDLGGQALQGRVIQAGHSL
ncbi:hypothetical protein D3C86_1361430 [compost metagenome]